MVDERVRIEIGFEGGQSLRVQVTAADADALDKAIAGDRAGAVALGLEDGVCTVVLSHVVYVTRYTRGREVGFGG